MGNTSDVNSRSMKSNLSQAPLHLQLFPCFLFLSLMTNWPRFPFATAFLFLCLWIMSFKIPLHASKYSTQIFLATYMSFVHSGRLAHMRERRKPLGKSLVLGDSLMLRKYFRSAANYMISKSSRETTSEMKLLKICNFQELKSMMCDYSWIL